VSRNRNPKATFFPVALLLSTILLPTTPRAGETGDIAQRYHEEAARLIGEAIVSNDAYESLEYLCDVIGHRLSGSPGLEQAVDWTADLMRRKGFSNVHEEEVMVPVWIRGEESARLTAPVERELNILGLGMSVGTPPGGIDAEVVVVESFDELDSLGAAGVRGKIVLYNQEYRGYGGTAAYRMDGPSRAAKYGAVAVLVRSVGPVSLNTPHTGTLIYDEEQPRIPAAAVTIEAATMMGRLARRGETMRAHLEMGARQLDDAPSANVIGEIPGSERPEEIVLLGGHLDSWDVGQGAQDDGVGCIIALEAAALIRRLDLAPRRTIRVVLFANEENGTRGGKAYHERHADELPRHVAAIESDLGNGAARGFRLDLRGREGEDEEELEELRDETLAAMRSIGELLELIGASGMRTGWSGVNISSIVADGVTGLGLDHDPEGYFDVHHSEADTFDKIDRGQLAKNVAAMAVMAYVLADMPGRLVQNRVAP